MYSAFRRTSGRITAEDAELDAELRNDLSCEYCGVPVTFVSAHFRNGLYIPHFFHLKIGMKTHWTINREVCEYDLGRHARLKLPSSRSHGVITNKDFKIKLTVPNELKHRLMELLADDLIPIQQPGDYDRAEKKLSDYIHSAKALSNIAHEWERNLALNDLELRILGATTRWSDMYVENWDLLYNKFSVPKPKEVVIMRGTFSSISPPLSDRNGQQWVEIVLKTAPISQNASDKTHTFARIKLFAPMFRSVIKQLESANTQSQKLEITFCGKIERILNKKDRTQQVKGIAVLRRQLHVQPLVFNES